MSSNIEVDNEVYDALAKRVTGFNQGPNDVLRVLLGLNAAKPSEPTNGADEQSKGLPTLVQFVESQSYRGRKTAVEKYLLLLSWLSKAHAVEFAKIERFRRGKRVYFATDSNLIHESGQSLSVKQIPGTSYYALATLDNRSKRVIIRDILDLFGYPHEICAKVAETIEDSGIRRSHSLLDGYADV